MSSGISPLRFRMDDWPGADGFKSGLLTEDQDRLAGQERGQVETGVLHEIRRPADRIAPEVKVPGGLADGQFEFLVEILLFGQHSSPEGHVTQVPPGRESVRIPGMSPDVADRVPGSSGQPVARVSAPCQLGMLVVVNDDLPSVSSPDCFLALDCSRIILSAEPCPFGEIGGLLSDRVRVDEVRVGEGGLYDSDPRPGGSSPPTC